MGDAGLEALAGVRERVGSRVSAPPTKTSSPASPLSDFDTITSIYSVSENKRSKFPKFHQREGGEEERTNSCNVARRCSNGNSPIRATAA